MQVIQIVIDVLIGSGLLIGLVILYKKQVGFLTKRIDVLERSLQGLQTEANALKTLTDRFLAVFAQLSPEKFLERVEVTEKLLEKGAKARIAQVEREAKGRLDAAVAEKEVREQMAREQAKELFGKLGSTTAVLALALYELPRDQRSILLARMRDEDQKKIVTELVTEIERAQGPSPAERSSTFGSLLVRALGPEPPEATPSSRLLLPIGTQATDVTPRTPAEPGGETLTSP